MKNVILGVVLFCMAILLQGCGDGYERGNTILQIPAIINSNGFCSTASIKVESNVFTIFPDVETKEVFITLNGHGYGKLVDNLKEGTNYKLVLENKVYYLSFKRNKTIVLDSYPFNLVPSIIWADDFMISSYDEGVNIYTDVLNNYNSFVEDESKKLSVEHAAILVVIATILK